MYELDKERDHEPTRDKHVDGLPPGHTSRSAQLHRAQEPTASGIVDGGAVEPESKLAGLIDAANASPSHGLPDGLRGELEEQVGSGLGGVRVHTGPESNEAASAMNARAYTMGNDVHFANGAYNPDSAAGRGLIAHEVAHVAQSGGNANAANGMAISSPNDAHEVEAHQFGEQFAAGEPTTKPTANASAIGRAIISRGGDDPVQTPMNPGGKASVGGGGKVGTKGAAVNIKFDYTKPLTSKGSSLLEASLKISGGGGGTLSWPEPEIAKKHGVSGDVGGGGSKSTGGGSESKAEHGGEKEFELYKAKAEEKAKNDEYWSKDWEVTDVKLVAGWGVEGSKSKEGDQTKKEKGGTAGLKVEATLKNGVKLTGDVSIAGKSGEEKTLSGPSLSFTMATPPLQKKWDLGKGWSADLTCAAAVTLTVKPDYIGLAKEAGKLIAEAGVVGALEFASTMAIVFAPALCMVSAISMIEDENELWHWAVREAKETTKAAYALAAGTALYGANPTTDRAAKAYLAGSRAALDAIAKQGCTQEEYKKEWEEGRFKSFSGLYRQCLNLSRASFDGAVDSRARKMYKDSFSQKFWKTEADVAATWREKATTAWENALRTGL